MRKVFQSEGWVLIPMSARSSLPAALISQTIGGWIKCLVYVQTRCLSSYCISDISFFIISKE